MTRDKLADVNYFGKMIEEQEEHARSFIERRKDAFDLQAISMISGVIFSDKVRAVSASYSRGDALDSVRNRMIEAIDSLKLLHELYERDPSYILRNYGAYWDKIHYLSYAILYKLPREQVDRVIYDVEFFRSTDPVVGAMLAYLKGKVYKTDVEAQDLEFPKSFVNLWQAIKFGPEAGAMFLQKYIKGWYSYWEPKRGDGPGGLGSHKKMIRYVGYWCWEAAAVAVMVGTDDTAFRDHEHYPKDLVDYARRLWAQQPSAE